MIHPHFVWMSYGWYTEGWWKANDVDCTHSEIERAVDRSLSFHHFPLSTEEEQDAPTDVNYVSNVIIVYQYKCIYSNVFGTMYLCKLIAEWIVIYIIYLDTQ